MPRSTRHAIERLPAQRAALERRLLADRSFRALCEDYGEAIEALRRWEGSSDPRSGERVAEFRALAAELEIEIRAYLAEG